jgi:hypothetical protein
MNALVELCGDTEVFMLTFYDDLTFPSVSYICPP